MPPVTHDEPPETLLRSLSVVGLWLLVINGMIGAGIFGLPAEAARLTGAWSPLVFLLCGLLIAPVMLTFSELSSYFGGTGGPILYARTAFGEFIGFQTGWAFYVARATALAANLNLLLSSAAFFLGGIDQGSERIAGLFVLCALLTAINVIGTRHAIGSVGVLTLLKLLPLGALVVLGAPQLVAYAPSLDHAAAPQAASLGAAMLLLVYAFVGFESALVPAGEARNPARDMPRALLWSLVAVTLLYMAIQGVCVVLLPDLANTQRPVVDAAAVLFGPIGTLLMTAGVVVSVGGNVAAAMLSTPRMTYALARSGQLPAVFATVHPTFKTPSVSIMIFGAVVFVLAISGSFVWLAAMSVMIRLLIYLTCIAAAPRLRRRYADAPNALRLPGGYVIPAIAAVLCAGLLVQVSWVSVMASTALLGVGTVLFLIAGRRNSES